MKYNIITPKGYLASEEPFCYVFSKKEAKKFGKEVEEIKKRFIKETGTPAKVVFSYE